MMIRSSGLRILRLWTSQGMDCWKCPQKSSIFPCWGTFTSPTTHSPIEDLRKFNYSTSLWEHRWRSWTSPTIVCSRCLIWESCQTFTLWTFRWAVLVCNSRSFIDNFCCFQSNSMRDLTPQQFSPFCNLKEIDLNNTSMEKCRCEEVTRFLYKKRDAHLLSSFYCDAISSGETSFRSVNPVNWKLFPF